MTLSDFCKETNNYFEREVKQAPFTISGGFLEDVSDFLQNGQYYRIVNSVFNDGVHKYPDDVLQDETFEGEVWAMAVPPDVLSLIDEINSWVDKYGDQANSPFSSETFFGDYSYTKSGAGSSSSSGINATDWTSIFAKKLNRWRKL